MSYFLRRTFILVGEKKFVSLITTNTIAQGDSRAGGIKVVLDKGGDINFALKSIKWPGVAVLEVSLLTLFKGKWCDDFVLNGKKVLTITSDLTDEEDIEPFRLKTNKGNSYIGSVILGKGFILNEAEYRKLIQSNGKNKEIIFPFLTGADLNSSYDQKPSRWIINFGEKSVDESILYEECFRIVESKVKPERIKVNRKTYRDRWWQYAEKCSAMYKAIEDFEKVLVVAQTSKTVAFSFVPNNYVFPMMTVVFSYNQWWQFGVMQSTLHNNWAWKYASTMKSDLRYVPTDIAQTFPFPPNISPEIKSPLEKIGEEYHEFRRQLMYRLQLGLTKTYNLFHTQDLTPAMVGKASKQDQATAVQAHADILNLRELHKEMDNAVLAAYGWTDIDLSHGFYDMDYLPENDRTRYTISPAARKEILKRLLQLNHDLYAQEVNAGLNSKKKISPQKTTTKKKKAHPGQGRLF